MKVENRSGELTISWRRNRALGVFLLFFSVIRNGVMFIFVNSAVSGPDAGISALLPLTLHILAGIGIFYFTLITLFNKTKIVANRGRLTVTNGPIPTFGNKEFSNGEIRQLYVIEAGKNKRGSKSTPIYAVRAQLSRGGEKTICSNLHDREKALKIERLLEENLRIQDQPVTVSEHPIEGMLKKFMPGVELPKDALPKPINEGKSERLQMDDSGDQPAPLPRESSFDLTDPLANGSGATLTLGELDQQIQSVTQYDWLNGTTDRSGKTDQSRFYSEGRDNDQRRFYEERALSPKEYLRLGLGNPNGLPTSFENGDEKYHQRESLEGYAYDDAGRGRAVQQYIYFTTSSPARFRVVVANDDLEVYIQEPIELLA